MTVRDYPNAEAYIEGEYPGETETIKAIVRRYVTASGVEEDWVHDKVINWKRIDDMDALITDIVGYYTGCLRADGTARVARGKRKDQS